MLNAPERKLLVLDYDETLTNKHVHNDLFSFLMDKAELADSKVRDFLPTFLNDEDFKAWYLKTLLKPENIKNASHIADMLVEAHQKGIAIGVASFTWFDFVVKPTLEFILKQEQVDSSTISDILDSVQVVAGYPSSNGPVIGGGNPGHPDAKQGHIKVLMDHFNIKDNASVALLDDSSTNVNTAIAAGHTAVLVPKVANPEPSYFNLLDKFLMTEEEQAGYDMLRQATDGLRIEDFGSDIDDFSDEAMDFDGQPLMDVSRVETMVAPKAFNFSWYVEAGQSFTPMRDKSLSNSSPERLSCSTELSRSLSDSADSLFNTLVKS